MGKNLSIKTENKYISEPPIQGYPEGGGMTQVAPSKFFKGEYNFTGFGFLRVAHF